MRFFQRTGFEDPLSHFGGSHLVKYLMGLRQGSHGAPLSWIQNSSVIANIVKGLDYGAHVIDPITSAVIHSIGAMFVDDTDLYY